MNAGKKYSQASLFIVLIIALLVLAGWQFDIELLKKAVPGLVAMNPVTAATFLLASVALFLVNINPKKSISIIANTLAVFVLLIGLLRLFDFAALISFKFDLWLFADKVGDEISNSSFRMSPSSAINFAFLGAAILALNIKRREAAEADFLAVGVAIIGFLSVIGFIYDAKELHGYSKNTPMALHTAICFFLLAYSIFSFHKDAGFIKEITSKNGGRQIAFKLIPLALLLPGFLGFLGLQALQNGISVSFSLAMVAIANSLILLFYTWKIVVSVNRSNTTLIDEIETRKKIESDLKKSNIFFDAVLDHIPDKVFVKDAMTLKYLLVNKAAENFLGLSNKEAIGNNDFFIFQKHEADVILQNDLDVLHSGKLFLIGEQRVVRDGKEYWNSIKKILIKEKDGTPLYIVGIASDITEAKKQRDGVLLFNKELEQEVVERTKELTKSEQRFRTLIESGIDSIKMMDANGVIFYASNSHERLIGYSPEELVSAEWISHLHPDDVEKAKQVLKLVNAELGVPKRLTLRIRHKQDFYVNVEGTLTNYLHDENIKAIICNFHDVSEKQKNEDEKRLLENALTNEKINRQKHIAQATIDIVEKERTAIGMELHDNINQILGAIKLYIGMAKSRPEKREEMLEKSEENLILCIQEVRKLSKTLVSPNIKMGLSLAIADLIEVVESSTELHFDFTVTGDDLGIIEEATQLSLYRIVQEQLNNIIKHANAKHVMLAIDFSHHILRLQLHDDGKGFELQKQSSGIGFRNMVNRIEFLKGTFEIITAKNEGCEISITIPVE
jgi:PAS domain S-box-containing protein